MKISMEHGWNNADRGLKNYSEKTLSQCHFVHHLGSNPGFRGERQAGLTFT